MFKITGMKIRSLDVEKSKKKRGLGIGSQAQVFVDSEVVRRMGPYIPFDTGVLAGSPSAMTNVGQGEVRQQTPYARRWYYTHKSKAKWFEKMKIDHKSSILEGVVRITGAKKG